MGRFISFPAGRATGRDSQLGRNHRNGQSCRHDAIQLSLPFRTPDSLEPFPRTQRGAEGSKRRRTRCDETQAEALKKDLARHSDHAQKDHQDCAQQRRRCEPQADGGQVPYPCDPHQMQRQDRGSRYDYRTGKYTYE